MARRACRDLFAGRRQLIVYRFFFEPGVNGWPEGGCPGCSMVGDQMAHVAHLNARDTTLAFVSRAPQADIERLKARMGWEVPWYTLTDDFDADFGVDEWHGTNAFLRDGDEISRTYFVDKRGDEVMGGTWAYLDITALGSPGDLGGLAGGLPADAGLRVVESPRRVRGWGGLRARPVGCDRLPARREQHVIALAHVGGFPLEEILPSVAAGLVVSRGWIIVRLRSLRQPKP